MENIKNFVEFLSEGKKVLDHPDIPEENQNGDCYQQGLRYFLDNVHSNPDLRLCHGLVTGQGAIKGIKYNHCWVEDIKKNKVFDMTMPDFFRNPDTDIYYYFGKINPDDVFRYGLDQVLAKEQEFGTYGPWEEKLLNNKY